MSDEPHIKKKKFERNQKAENEAVRLHFNKERSKWLDEVLRKLLPPTVYTELLKRSPWALEEINRRGIYWKPTGITRPDDKTVKVAFGLFRRGVVTPIASGFDFLVTHDGHLSGLDVAEILAPGTKKEFAS